MKRLYLKGENDQYVTRDPTGNYKLTSDLDKALFIPETEIKKMKAIQINNIPKVLKKFGPYKIMKTEDEGIETTPTDDMVNEIIDSMNTFSEQVNQVTSCKEELRSIISYTDLEISDLLHYIEFHKFSAAEGYKLCKKLQEICDRRREAKNKLHVINVVKGQSCENIMSGNASRTIESLVGNKQYQPRVFSDLFKDNQSRIRLEKSVKIKLSNK